MSLASCTGFTASIMTDSPRFSCSPARASATKYAANPVSKLLFRPLLMREDSTGSTENSGTERFSARLSATALLPEPGKPEMIINFDLFMPLIYQVSLDTCVGSLGYPFQN